MRTILVAALALIAVSCNSKPQAVERSTNTGVTVVLLTTWQDGADGCKLWRVEADSKQVYVARCGPDVRAYEQHTTGSSKHHRTVRTEALTASAEPR